VGYSNGHKGKINNVYITPPPFGSIPSTGGSEKEEREKKMYDCKRGHSEKRKTKLNV
jgi:hypothetical protein